MASVFMRRVSFQEQRDAVARQAEFVQMTTGSQQAAASVQEMTKIAAQTAEHSRSVVDATEEQLATMQELSATAGIAQPNGARAERLAEAVSIVAA
jgi:methyl-accepting chemotaxis protein